jgi:heterodisulfide reductase subunit C
MCGACRAACREAEQMRRRPREIEENIQRQEEELERAMGSHGMFNIASF